MDHEDVAQEAKADGLLHQILEQYRFMADQVK